jgi:hypothetical protein
MTDERPITLAEAAAEYRMTVSTLRAEAMTPDEKRRERQRRYNRKRYLRDPEASKARVTKWAQENKHKRVKIQRAFRARKPADYGRWARIKSEYGITKAAWEALFEAQGRMCEICKRTDSGAHHAWHTDHDHKTGAIRNILCHQCNTMLGRAKDNASVLRAAADYLDRHARGGARD